MIIMITMMMMIIMMMNKMMTRLLPDSLFNPNDNDDDCYDDHLTAEVLYEGQRLPPLVAHQAHCALVNHC